MRDGLDWSDLGSLFVPKGFNCGKQRRGRRLRAQSHTWHSAHVSLCVVMTRDKRGLFTAEQGHWKEQRGHGNRCRWQTRGCQVLQKRLAKPNRLMFPDTLKRNSLFIPDFCIIKQSRCKQVWLDVKSF